MLEEKHYQDEDFYGQAILLPELSRKEFIHCGFAQADFTDIDIVYSCRFDNCDFSSTAMNGVTFRGCAFTNCKFRHTVFFATTFDDCKLTGSEFIQVDFGMLTIAGGGDWSHTSLRFIEFRKQTLQDINFTGADLTEAKFISCKISGCTFSDAIADKTSFYQSDIRSCDISGLDVFGVDWRGALVDEIQCVVMAEAMGAKYKP